MINKIKTFIMTSSAALALLVAGLAMPLTVNAAISDTLCEGANAAAGAPSASCDNSRTGDNATNKITALAQTVTRWFTIIVGAISVIMIIYGGFRYITSGGDSGKVGNAKNTIIYAIIGLIIVAIAQIIVNVVVSQAGESV